MATIRKTPSGTWEAQIRRRGARSQTKTFRTRAMAERWARGVEDQIASGVFSDRAVAARTTVKELLERYEDKFTGRKRQHSERSRLKQLTRALGKYTALELTPDVVVGYVHDRLAAGLAVQTVVHELNTLSVVMRTAMALWAINLPANPVVTAREILKPMGTLTVRNERTRRPTDDELEALRKALPGLLPKLMDFAIETCMRRGELAAQRREHRTGAELLIPETKTDRPRTIPLSPAAQAILDELPSRVDGYTWGIRPDTVTQAFGRACRRLKIVDLRWHDLRHEGTSRLFEGRTFGRPLGVMEAALVTGHRDVRQLQRYTQLRAEHVSGGVDISANG